MQVVHLFDSFQHRGPHGRHVAMVFEVLGSNLLRLIKKYRYKGIPIDDVRVIMRQLLEVGELFAFAKGVWGWRVILVLNGLVWSLVF